MPELPSIPTACSNRQTASNSWERPRRCPHRPRPTGICRTQRQDQSSEAPWPRPPFSSEPGGSTRPRRHLALDCHPGSELERRHRSAPASTGGSARLLANEDQRGRENSLDLMDQWFEIEQSQVGSLAVASSKGVGGLPDPVGRLLQSPLHRRDRRPHMGHCPVVAPSSSTIVVLMDVGPRHGFVL